MFYNVPRSAFKTSLKKENKNMSKFIDFGTGIYTPKDIEQIINVNSRAVRYWLRSLKTNIKDKEIFYEGEKRDLVTNFYTMIEIHMFYEFRKRKVSPQRIYRAYKAVSKMLNTDYPFANSGFMVSGRSILLEFENSLITTTGDDQFVFEEIVMPYAEKIEFNVDTKLANRYFPLGKERGIEVDPEKKFGQPVIIGTRINTAVILDYYNGGDAPVYIADLFDVDVKYIDDVLKFYKKVA